MKMTKNKFRFFLLLKLPIAFLAGIKLHLLSENEAKIKVSFGFLNQNPFRSMFWAVQGMAAELSTGILCLEEIQQHKKKISMLVIEQKGVFTKKAVGKITFSCTQRKEVRELMQKVASSNQAHTIKLQSKGIDENNECVSQFEFLWSFKAKQ
ncbi:MAG: thioesterase [Flavobacteriales bacterium]|nr:thioesterase [Flavobacteriales bacterium]